MASEVEKDPTETREGLLLLARIAIAGNHYRHMLNYMKSLIEIVMPTEDLSELERKCFSSACNLLVDGQLNSWRHLSLKAANVAAINSRREAARAYQELIADEISETCKEIVEFIDRSVLPAGDVAATKAMSTESRVFYKKMKGDYLGHAAEVKKGLERVKAVEAALEAYHTAMEAAVELPETNLTRLKLALHLAVFHAEICESLIMAYTIARKAVDIAKRALEISGGETSEITRVLEELQNNIDIWMAKLTG